MVERLPQPLNASVAILVVLAGIDTPVNPVHPENAPLPIVVTPDGNAIEDKLLQFAKALGPILLIDAEIAILVNALQPENILFGIAATLA